MILPKYKGPPIAIAIKVYYTPGIGPPIIIMIYNISCIGPPIGIMVYDTPYMYIKVLP